MNNKEHQLREELKKIQDQLQNPAIYTDPSYPKLAKRQKELEEIISLFNQLAKNQQAYEASQKLAQCKDELADLAKAELEDLEKQKGKILKALDRALTPKDPNDDRDVIVEIRAAAGGDESSLFAGELYRMYARWSENHEYKVEHIDDSPNEVGGYKEISFAIRGENAYKNLKFEAGVHRVQRVPTTESQGRVHTSTVTVAVMPEAEETDLQINPNDLRIDVFRASGHGGQSVNTTDSAVRITHLPTGTVVTCQDEKSQLKNKDKAMGVLRSRLLQEKIDTQNAKLSEARRKLIGSGDRSEKIRTYNVPQDRITDHRIGYSRSNVLGALDGDIDDLIENLQSFEHKLIQAE